MTSTPSHARPAQTQPVPIPTALAKARAACGNQASIPACRAALRRAYAGLEWQRAERIKAERNTRGYGVNHAIRLAAALYGINERDFNRVASCESGHDPSVVNGHRTVRNKDTTPLAVGLMQWLLGSWRTQGLPGFSRTDPYASALAAGRAVSRNGSWRQWSCKP